ncbi:hypothetical protein GCM10027098_24630 [Bowmanella dokdonensis]
MGLNNRLTNGNGTHWNSEAGREAVKYRDIFHITQLDEEMAPARRVEANMKDKHTLDFYSGLAGHCQ